MSALSKRSRRRGIAAVQKLFAEKFQDGVANIIDIFQRQFAIDRQRQNFFHYGFGVRELWQVRIKFRDRRLLVIRHGIMDAGADSSALQMLRQFIA